MSYIEHLTGEPIQAKPDDKTELYAGRLIDKEANIIRLRGKIDSLQAEIIAVQTGLSSQRLNKELDEVLALLRRFMRAEVLCEPLGGYTLFGLEEDALREQSHQSGKYYGVPVMHLPSRQDGEVCAQLNLLRAHVRETELSAVAAYRDGMLSMEFISCLNRLSSALHILICREIAGEYGG